MESVESRTTYFLCSPRGIQFIELDHPFFKEVVLEPPFPNAASREIPDSVPFLERIYEGRQFRYNGWVWSVMVDKWQSEALVAELIGTCLTAFACWLFRWRWNTLGPIPER